ncbi:hypothetical protein ALC60_13271 [Trachymyrmex zeteki]|uniref:Uncharacterized protein n=1 Tax=Mycetomoellerius zeteki TaxID=64791 RepID=A0A151WIQ4_9HYME|nr:hypothetical protein ALC60_13271 [Trachymyrmex zeteki]
MASLEEESRKRKPAVLVSSSGSEEESNERRRGRPALNPDNVGKFTAKARARRADRAKARQLKRDHLLIIDPEVAPSSASARKAVERAVELALEYEEQPLGAVAAVATRELGTIAKAVEKSRNIKGDIVRDLWTAYAKLSAALSTTVSRASEQVGDDGPNSADSAVEERRFSVRVWEEERRRLRHEVTLLRAEKERLEGEVREGRNPPSEAAPKTMSAAKGAADGEMGPPPMILMEEDLRAPFFRPPLQGVAKQLNPLARGEDRGPSVAGIKRKGKAATKRSSQGSSPAS